MSKMKLTEVRRARIVEILKPLGDGVSIFRKAELISRSLGEPCDQSDAMSLLNQFRKPKPRRRRGKTRAEIEQEGFEKMKAQRTDVY